MKRFAIKLIISLSLIFTLISCKSKYDKAFEYYLQPIDDIETIFDNEVSTDNYNITIQSVESQDKSNIINDDSKNENQFNAITDATVWITKSGSKYHNKPDCSNMKSATEIKYNEAVSKGLEPCKRCYKQ